VPFLTQIQVEIMGKCCNNESFAQTVINARDFGAVGDGRTDDTCALQTALTMAAAKRCSVLLPPGTYLTGTLKIHPYSGLVGDATWGYRTGGGSCLRLADSGTRCFLDITGAIGATVHGLSLHGGDLGSGIHGIMMGENPTKKEEDSPRIERCHISHFSGNGIHLDPVWCFSVRSCEVIFNKGHGLWINGWDGFILDNWFSGNGGAGYAATEANASVTMTGNRIEWNRGGGILLAGGTHYNITGNYIDRSGGPGITVKGRNGAPSLCLTITGNVIYRSGKPEWTPAAEQSAHILLEDAHGVTCVGNSMCVGRDDSGGINSPLYGLVVRRLQNSVVKDNTMHIGAIRQLLDDQGGHKEGVIIADNVGSLYADLDKAIWESAAR